MQAVFNSQWVRRVVLALVPFVLAACAHPQLMSLNMPGEEIVSELGAPDARITLENGNTRLVYSLQPMSQEVWWLTLSPEGRLVSREQILDRQHFALIKPGVSTQKDVHNLFGKCAQKYTFRLINQTAWMYRFLDSGAFYMACWVQFDTNGVVTEVGYTTDPWRDRDDSNFIGI